MLPLQGDNIPFPHRIKMRIMQTKELMLQPLVNLQGARVGRLVTAPLPAPQYLRSSTILTRT